MVIGIVMGIAFAACSPSVKVPEPVEGPSLELSAIDSLMWRQPDSALAQLQRFAISPAADSLDEFNGHYCQLLVSELLYKNYKPQSNRDELLQAVDYFDSIVAADEADTHKADKRGASLRERNVFLDARAHYINGAGYYERGEVVNGCAEYLKALEVMEEQFEEKALTGKKAVFMFYIYNRLLELFSAQFMMDPALACGEKALEICLNDPSLSKEIPNLYSHIGKQYEKKGEKEIARNYYGLAIEGLSDANSLVYRDAVSIKALSDYNVGLGADSSLTAIKQVLAQANTEKERLTRFLTIGVIFTAERFFDSALYYLEPVFENEDNVSLQMQAAEYLIVSYNNLGNKEKADECILFLSNYKKTDGENKALVSKLEDLYKDYSNQKKEKESEEAREKSIKETVEIIVPIAIMVALAVFIVVKLRSKKQLKQQHEKADKALEEKEQEHEETLKRLQAESEQHLAEAEKKHQQWMADAEERHSEELRTQKDRADKEMEKTKKRHNEELEAVRLTHQQEMETKEQAAQHEREQYEEASRQRDAKAAQRLEEAEQRHHEKTAEMAQRHEEEMRSLHDKTEDEISATQKRYEQELEAVRQAHQQEMEAKAAEAKADRERHEEELRRRREQAEQWLAEAELDYRRKVAELAKRQEEETRRQQEKMEQEREQAKKRHEAELEAERMAYKKEQEALRQSLRQRDAQVTALETAMVQQREEAERRREAFLKEPICQRILGQVRRKTITTRENAFELGLSLKDEDFEQLGTAVEKHYEGFDNMLLSQCPSLKQGLISLCHLHLLGINEREIAVLKNVSYSAIKKQNESLQEKLGVEEKVAEYVLRVSEGLVGHAYDAMKEGPMHGKQESSQKSSQKNSQKIVDLIKERPEITTAEMAEKIGVSRRSIVNITNRLQEEGVIRRVGPDKGGHWEVVR